MKISIDIVGDTAVEARLDALPLKLRNALRAKIYALTLNLEGHIKADKLSGQVLNVVTGRLRRSIFSKVDEGETEIVGTVASSGDVKYAGRHEYGFDGVETVQAHSRTIKQAFGKEISPKVIAVKEFTRQAHTPERSFMRSALADQREDIKAGIRKAIEDALQ